MMYFQKNKFLIILFTLLALIHGCRKTSETTVESYPNPVVLNVPPGFPIPILPPENPLTKEGIALGRLLYTDPILSSNGKSCSSCHTKEKAFSAEYFLTGNGEKISILPHINLAFKTNYNWNGSVAFLDTLCMDDFGPDIFATVEQDLYQKLSAHPVYSQLFKQAFGIEKITGLSYYELKKYICYAISQYMRTKISADSKYDRYRSYKVRLTEDEYAGLAIFFSEKGDCFHCHAAPLFTDDQFHNNGLNDNFTGLDAGRKNVTGKIFDEGKFLTPTLRNIALTAPYMHDGRFSTLEEVIEFYNSGVKTSSTLDPIMQKRKNTSSLSLTPLEKKQLLSFLKTLTDSTFTNAY